MEFKHQSISGILSSDFNITGKVKTFAYKDRISTDVIDGISDYLRNDDFDSTLSSKFTSDSYRYEISSHAFYLDICGNTLSIDAKDLIKERMIKRVYISSSQELSIKYLNIEFYVYPTSSDISSVDLVSIRIDDMFPTSKEGHAISVDDELTIHVKSDVISTDIDLSSYSKTTYVDNKLTSISEDSFLSNFMTKDEDDIEVEEMLSALKFILKKFGAN